MYDVYAKSEQSNKNPGSDGKWVNRAVCQTVEAALQCMKKCESEGAMVKVLAYDSSGAVVIARSKNC